MPIKNGMGLSEETIYKENNLRDILFWQFSILKYSKTWETKKLIYIDMNAGSGINKVDDLTINGSPLIALEVMTLSKIKFDIIKFIDEKPGLIANLTKKIGHNKYSVCGDNKEKVWDILNKYNPKDLYGIIYFDPNGMPDFNLIANISRKFPKLDILVHFSATTIKRVEKACYPGKTLYNSLMKIEKEKWIIKESESGNKFQWAFILGSNYGGLTGWKKRGFYLLNSEEGIDILTRLNYTAKELKMVEEIKQRRMEELFDEN